MDILDVWQLNGCDGVEMALLFFFVTALVLIGLTTPKLTDISGYCPLQVSGKPLDGLLTLKPLCHLLDLVLLIGCMKGRLCKVDVKTFRTLGTVAIH